MALNEASVLKAKAEAREFLEYSVFLLATLLDIEPEDISADMTIPVDELNHEFPYYESLVKQVRILESLGD